MSRILFSLVVLAFVEEVLLGDEYSRRLRAADKLMRAEVERVLVEKAAGVQVVRV